MSLKQKCLTSRYEEEGLSYREERPKLLLEASKILHTRVWRMHQMISNWHSWITLKEGKSNKQAGQFKRPVDHSPWSADQGSKGSRTIAGQLTQKGGLLAE